MGSAVGAAVITSIMAHTDTSDREIVSDNYFKQLDMHIHTDIHILCM